MRTGAPGTACHRIVGTGVTLAVVFGWHEQTCLLASDVPPAVPSSPAQAQPAPLPDLVRMYSPRELLGVHESVFVTLFDKPWSADHWEYVLSTVPNGKGTHTGVNQYGQPFTLNIVMYVEPDINKAELTPELREQVKANQVRLAAVFGTLSTPLATLALHGHVFTMTPPGQATVSKFWLCNTLDPKSPIFEPGANMPDVFPTTKPTQGDVTKE